MHRQAFNLVSFTYQFFFFSNQVILVLTNHVL